MNTIISKSLDALIKQAKRIPYALIILFLFTLLFPTAATDIKKILISKTKILLPESSIEFIKKIQLSQEELLNIWLFLLTLFAFIIILDIAKQLLEEKSYIIIGSGGEFLLTINSIIFLLTLIQNKTSRNKMTLLFEPITVYKGFAFISFLIFILFFAITYFGIIGLVFSKIQESEIKFKFKIIYGIIFLLLIYWLITSILITLTY